VSSRRRRARRRPTRASKRASRRSTTTAGFPDEFVSGLRDVLDRELVGVYLHGSKALGDFNPRESDIDFLVATEDDLDAETVERLAALHLRLGDLLDGSYLPRDVFRRFDPARVMHPHIESRGGRLLVDHHGGETVIYRYVLRKCGVTLFGPPPHELIDPVDAEQLRASVRDLVANWWVPMLDEASRFDDATYRRYMVLTMCRVRFTLAEGDVVSKPAAARWALDHVEPKWHSVIERAAAYRECGYDETVALVRATLAVASC
jgi:predicted nucleotidyltransferase